ncbi:MAG: (d)CMP kinase [Oscillospiraceae bacterium]|nr:(d)CMP kinase [Oscillospiraceae bacterium]
MIIAIDGPAGAGKSTVARLAAAALCFVYIDTGALYRAVGLAAMRAGADLNDPGAVAAVLPGVRLSITYDESGGQHIFLGSEDVSLSIRTPECSMAASAVGRVPAVRAFLLETQRSLARARSSVLDGRDIGTVVLPEADVKIFLTASPEERAARRWKELQARGVDEPYEKVLAEVVERDRQDTGRPIAPLRPAEDSVTLDTTGLTLEEAVARVVNLARQNAPAE